MTINISIHYNLEIGLDNRSKEYVGCKIISPELKKIIFGSHHAINILMHLEHEKQIAGKMLHTSTLKQHDVGLMLLQHFLAQITLTKHAGNRSEEHTSEIQS